MSDPLAQDVAANWIDTLYQSVLGRPPDPRGREHYLKSLTAGSLSPLDFVKALVSSDEFTARQHCSTVIDRELVLAQPPLPTPAGVTRGEILDTLISVSIDQGQSGELENYAREDCNRFLYTLDLVPSRSLSLLEIGANPYFTSILLELFRPDARCTHVNYFGGEVSECKQDVTYRHKEQNRSRVFNYTNANVEVHSLPFASQSFDVVLYCEVIEHMVNDPRRSLLELKRLLKPQGLLIITTPNVARLENVARLISGANIYDPYSGYGPYGRHNREYTRHELWRLLSSCGFTDDVFFTADVHENRAHHFVKPSELPGALAARSSDLGQYLFSRWVNSEQAATLKPGWLYRSYPPGELDPT